MDWLLPYLPIVFGLWLLGIGKVMHGLLEKRVNGLINSSSDRIAAGLSTPPTPEVKATILGMARVIIDAAAGWEATLTFLSTGFATIIATIAVMTKQRMVGWAAVIMFLLVCTLVYFVPMLFSVNLDEIAPSQGKKGYDKRMTTVMAAMSVALLFATYASLRTDVRDLPQEILAFEPKPGSLELDYRYVVKGDASNREAPLTCQDVHNLTGLSEGVITEFFVEFKAGQPQCTVRYGRPSPGKKYDIVFSRSTHDYLYTVEEVRGG